MILPVDKFFLLRWLNERKSLLIRVGIIAFILLTSAILAPRFALGNSRNIRLLFLMMAGIMGVVIFLRWHFLGLPLIIVSAFFISYNLISNFHVAIILLGGMIVLWLFEMFATQRRFSLYPSRTSIPAILFILVAGLSFGFGQLPWFWTQSAPLTAQLGGLVIFILSMGGFLLIANRVSSLRGLQWITWLFLIFGGGYIAARIFPLIGQLVLGYYQDGSSSSIFWIWLVSLAFSQAIFNRSLDRRIKAFLLLLVGATFYVAFVQAQAWTSGWLPAAVSLLVILMVGAFKVSLPVLFTAGVWVAIKAQNLVRLVMVGDNEYSLLTRVEAWKIMIEIIKVNPLLGVGPANYHFYTPLFPILGYAVQFNSHNNYIDIIAQTGLLGLVCFFWLAWEIWRLGWRLRRSVPEGFAKAYVYGCMGALIATMVSAMLGDWVIPFVYNVGLIGFRGSIFGWFFLGGLVVIERLYSRPEDIRSS